LSTYDVAEYARRLRVGGVVSVAVPVLLYHRLDDGPSPYSTSPTVFRQHMEFLLDRGWRPLSSEEMTFALVRRRDPPPKSFLLTFDDGHASVYGGVSVLQDLGIPGILFLTTTEIGNPGGAADAEDQYLSWDQVREIQSSGLLDCHSHSHSHTDFAACSPAELEYDLRTSVETLSAELDVKKDHFSHFAWPWGSSRPSWQQIAADIGFRYQYTVSRLAHRVEYDHQCIERTCFDGLSVRDFRTRIRLQSGRLAPIWDRGYPLARRARKAMRDVGRRRLCRRAGRTDRKP
jgi:peptidoglycan/xylan/chitin deacetylase (PgdA/CDA1 family)